ncbi:beta-glucosidase [Actinoplanes sp. NBRC 14428]|uniref:Beta-glucosidase n=1 Tax=Pseudosporangium ferrugineum TaxID=439699 RepID=A0A2T0S2U3_9ACTN|nr:GH1 family beta-glucosidase [Pseudosporangium ferrugineum]PRY27727.1 beta-glucosidase [Pseudosporangium ferrugineum]BCJ55503.1 beta-glucosidase [Actinoplanes sp. NBRC 14428]
MNPTVSSAPGLLLPAADFPPSFKWGVATSSYQIEGAVAEDGRTPSIWDTFCRVPGAVAGGDHGDVACDHYHRMPQDVALIKSLGVDTYRFSVAWPRVQPHGRGPVNPAGLGFYDRLTDELLTAGVDPWVTLYHWDLPQELEDAGGWPNRDTAYRFADYAMLVFDKLSDRVETWTTMNEPWCSAWLGYATGVHAPGRKDFDAALAAVHHLLLGHGLATQRMRAAATREHTFGITLNMGTADPATDTQRDRDAARRADGMGLRIYLDPLHRGAYPQDMVDDLAARGASFPVQDGDLEIISTPFEVLGVNFYFGQDFSGTDEDGNEVDADGHPVVRAVIPDRPRTAMNWPITPERFTQLLVRLHRDYPGLPLVVTENGAAFDDAADESGFVADEDRTAYLAEHIAAVAAAREQGADVRGYFAWSLMDNFEWAEGYAKRFGIVHVDYETQERTPKQSALWYRDTISRHRNA